ncbi:DUF3040 domain-containing protein [Streptomyces odontomachi]|uniref:DUF3040 domain-containing protein n=1 Tax=Streptomyces odontomachi TaxID=2944940 RepID=UPI00210F1D37|nr:DUF3040 domain-containing protein [Streptomyces sp. ODS25]
MAKGRLPEHEQRILDEMEAALDRDHRLHRRLSAVRFACQLRAGWAAATAARGFFVALAALASLILLVVGARTANAGVIWAFAATSTAMLLTGRGLRRRRTDRRLGTPTSGP